MQWIEHVVGFAGNDTVNMHDSEVSFLNPAVANLVMINLLALS